MASCSGKWKKISPFPKSFFLDILSYFSCGPFILLMVGLFHHSTALRWFIWRLIKDFSCTFECQRPQKNLKTSLKDSVSKTKVMLIFTKSRFVCLQRKIWMTRSERFVDEIEVFHVNLPYTGRGLLSLSTLTQGRFGIATRNLV